MKPFHFLSKHYLLSAADNSPLIVFRIIFGFLIMAEAWGAVFTGWVKKAFVDPEFTFSFIGFEWLQPLPGDGMYYYFFVMGAIGLMVMLGWYYRIAVVTYFLMWTAVYLMQKTHYNNHYYLLMLLLGLMIFMPAHRYLSLDAKRNPAIKSLTCPSWVYVVFILQVWIVYTYAAFSKVYPDWMAAVPVKMWFGSKKDYWLVGELLQQEWVCYGVAWGGILFDLLVVPGLLWRRTRMLTFALSIFFHLFNSAIFQIGIFPYLALSFSLFFFDPEKVRSVFLRRKPPLTGEELAMKQYRLSSDIPLYLAYLFFAFQLFLPLRYHLYPGNVHWTEEGHRLAWKMMLRSKSGFIQFRVVNKSTGEERKVNPGEYLTKHQYRDLATKPDMIWQFVQRLKAKLAEEGWDEVEIYANARCSLNGRPYQNIILPDYDLAKAQWSVFRTSEWIRHLE